MSPVGGYKLSPWIAANKIINKLTQKLFPKSSNGRFFSKGWATEEGGLSFLVWLKSLTKISTASKILLVDPYFDTSGVIELIARAGATQTEYVVLTNTQVKSDDDSPNEIITLFDSNRNTDTSSHSNSKHQQGIAAIPYAGLFFAALLNENRLSDLEESELSNNLQDKGILIREGSEFTVTKQVNAQLRACHQLSQITAAAR